MSKGSHATRGGWEPKTCVYGDRCLHGGKLVLSADHALWFHLDHVTGDIVGRHMDCFRELEASDRPRSVTCPAPTGDCEPAATTAAGNTHIGGRRAVHSAPVRAGVGAGRPATPEAPMTETPPPTEPAPDPEPDTDGDDE